VYVVRFSKSTESSRSLQLQESSGQTAFSSTDGAVWGIYGPCDGAMELQVDRVCLTFELRRRMLRRVHYSG
jgi:hypothetical protein